MSNINLDLRSPTLPQCTKGNDGIYHFNISDVQQKDILIVWVPTWIGIKPYDQITVTVHNYHEYKYTTSPYIVHENDIHQPVIEINIPTEKLNNGSFKLLYDVVDIGYNHVPSPSITLVIENIQDPKHSNIPTDVKYLRVIQDPHAILYANGINRTEIILDIVLSNKRGGIIEPDKIDQSKLSIKLIDYITGKPIQEKYNLITHTNSNNFTQFIKSAPEKLNSGIRLAWYISIERLYSSIMELGFVIYYDGQEIGRSVAQSHFTEHATINVYYKINHTADDLAVIYKNIPHKDQVEPPHSFGHPDKEGNLWRQDNYTIKFSDSEFKIKHWVGNGNVLSFEDLKIGAYSLLYTDDDFLSMYDFSFYNGFLRSAILCNKNHPQKANISFINPNTLFSDRKKEIIDIGKEDNDITIVVLSSFGIFSYWNVCNPERNYSIIFYDQFGNEGIIYLTKLFDSYSNVKSYQPISSQKSSWFREFKNSHNIIIKNNHEKKYIFGDNAWFQPKKFLFPNISLADKSSLKSNELDCIKWQGELAINSDNEITLNIGRNNFMNGIDYNYNITPAQQFPDGSINLLCLYEEIIYENYEKNTGDEFSHSIYYINIDWHNDSLYLIYIYNDHPKYICYVPWKLSFNDALIATFAGWSDGYDNPSKDSEPFLWQFEPYQDY